MFSTAGFSPTEGAAGRAIAGVLTGVVVASVELKGIAGVVPRGSKGFNGVIVGGGAGVLGRIAVEPIGGCCDVVDGTAAMCGVGAKVGAGGGALAGVPPNQAGGDAALVAGW